MARPISPCGARPTGRGSSRHRPRLHRTGHVQWGLTGDIPIPNVTVANAIAISRRTVANGMRTADLDGDGRADLNVYRPSNGTWFNLQSKTNYDANQARAFQWGLSGDIPVSSDYDGDGVTDIAVWRPSNGVWFILQSSSGFTTVAGRPVGPDGRCAGRGRLRRRRQSRPRRVSAGERHMVHPDVDQRLYHARSALQWGLPGDLPVPGDYDGDSKTDLAVWRPSTGEWFIVSTSSGTATLVTFTLGSTGDIPVPGDYDGDGKTDGAVFRPSSGTWTIRSSSDGDARSVVSVWPQRGHAGTGRFRRRRQDRSHLLASVRRFVVHLTFDHELYHGEHVSVGIERRHPDTAAPVAERSCDGAGRSQGSRLLAFGSSRTFEQLLEDFARAESQEPRAWDRPVTVTQSHCLRQLTPLYGEGRSGDASEDRQHRSIQSFERIGFEQRHHLTPERRVLAIRQRRVSSGSSIPPERHRGRGLLSRPGADDSLRALHPLIPAAIEQHR